MQKKYVFLDGLRGIAALAVVINHFTKHDPRGEIFASAGLAVDLFFCLSGFVIANAYLKRLQTGMSFREYTLKRLIRLYPMFLIGLLSGFFVMIMMIQSGNSDFTVAEATSALFLNSLYLPYLNHIEYQVFTETSKAIIFPFNPAAWSLFFELVANILFVFTVRWSVMRIGFVTAILGVWLAFLSLGHGGTLGWGTENVIGGFPRVGYSFMLGVLIFKLIDIKKPKLPSNPLLIAALVSIILMVPLSHYWSAFFTLGMLVLMPAMVLFGTQVEIKDVRMKGICEWLGWISYPIYCIHMPIMFGLSLLYPEPEHFYVFSMVSIFSIIIITSFFAKYFDEPVRAWLSKKSSSLVFRKTS